MRPGTRTKDNALQQFSMAVTVMIDQHINNQAAEQQLDLQSMQRSHFQDSIKYYGPDLIFCWIGTKLLQQPASNLSV